MKELLNDIIRQSLLSDKQFASELGLTPPQLSRFKKTKHVDVDKLKKYSVAFGVTEIRGNVNGSEVNITFKK